MGENFKKGIYESTHKCAKCGEYAVSGQHPSGMNNELLIGYNCENCGDETSGEEPFDSIPIGNEMKNNEKDNR